MSEFLYVTVAAMAILVAGGILGGFGMTGGTGGAVASEPLFFEHLGTVGASMDVEPTSRDINLGSFTVEETSPNATVYEHNQITVKNSGLGGSSAKTIEFDASRPRKAYLSFIPTTAASADNLILLVNGEQVPVTDMGTNRRVTVPIDKKYLQRGSNVLRMEVKDPGLAVWRSPTFELENVQVILNDLQNSGVVKPFSASDTIIRGFYYGEVEYFVTDNVVQDEPLEIRINGNPVATRTPFKQSSPYTVSFFANTTGISAGENVLTFDTGGDSQYPLKNVKVKLFYLDTPQEHTIIREFDVTPAAYKTLGKDEWQGQIAFDVEKTLLDRPLSVQLPNKSWMFMPQPGRNTRTFDQRDIGQGTNKMKLSTAGSYNIKNFNVSLVKAR